MRSQTGLGLFASW